MNSPDAPNSDSSGDAAPPRFPGLPGLPGLRGPAGGAPEPAADTPVCSAKGCRADAVWVLAWNNPKLHTPERRKTWLACEEHREHLSNFLELRGFLKDVVTLEAWEQAAADRPADG